MVRKNLTIWVGFRKSYVIVRVGHGKSLRPLTRWVGGLKKGPKHACVIFEWKLQFEMKRTKLYWKMLLVKSSENNFIFYLHFSWLCVSWKLQSLFENIRAGFPRRCQNSLYDAFWGMIFFSTNAPVERLNFVFIFTLSGTIFGTSFKTISETIWRQFQKQV